ncbi:hypothetical protein BH24ACT26_BH24ACT26_21840 [soil metagenome]
MARARVEQAVATVAGELRVARVGGLVETLEAAGGDILVLDLDQGGEASLEELVAANAADLAPPRVIGFFSHVDDELGRAARAAGCEALPRGRFWRTLPELLGAVPPED